MFRSDEGKKIRSHLIIFAAVFLALLIINRYILISFVPDDYKIYINQSKMFFHNGISPYGLQSQNYLSSLADTEGWKIVSRESFLTNSIFALFFYFPFSLIHNYEWSGALFITINQVCILLSIHMAFDMLEWKPNIFERSIIYLLTASVFFVSTNLILMNIAVFQFTILICALYFGEKGKGILSGIFLGLSVIDPISIFYIITSILIIFVATKKFTSLTWALITVTLISLFSFIFDRNWIVSWLKTLFLTPTRYPFLSYIDSAKLKYNMQFNQIITVIPIILLSWILLEIIRTPKDEITKNIWLLSIIGILNHYLMVQNIPNTEIFFLLALILLIGMWGKKMNNKVRIVFYVVFGIFNYIMFKWHYINLTSNIELILFIIGLFFLLNLYWIRPWILKQYAINENRKNSLY